MTEWGSDKIEKLREQVTVLKAERDEAIRTRDEIQHVLLNMLARIHGDGGHYVVEHGFEKAILDADDVVVRLLSDRRAFTESCKQ